MWSEVSGVYYLKIHRNNRGYRNVGITLLILGVLTLPLTYIFTLGISFSITLVSVAIVFLLLYINLPRYSITVSGHVIHLPNCNSFTLRNVVEVTILRTLIVHKYGLSRVVSGLRVKYRYGSEVKLLKLNTFSWSSEEVLEFCKYLNMYSEVFRYRVKTRTCLII